MNSKNQHWVEEGTRKWFVMQIKGLLDLPFLDYDKRIKEIKKEAKEKGYDDEKFQSLVEEAARKSNFNNSKYLEDEVQRKTGKEGYKTVTFFRSKRYF